MFAFDYRALEIILELVNAKLFQMQINAIRQRHTLIVWYFFQGVCHNFDFGNKLAANNPNGPNGAFSIVHELQKEFLATFEMFTEKGKIEHNWT